MTPVVASAAITQYSDRSAFETATGATTVETFGPTFHFPIPSGVLNAQTGPCCAFNGDGATFGSGPPLEPGDILPGVTYSTPVLGPGCCYLAIDTQANYDGGFLDTTQSNGQTLTVTFDQAQAAVGFDAGSLMGNGFVITLFGADDQQIASLTDAITSQTPAFYGFANDTADITKLTLTTTTPGVDGFAIDNFTFGATSAVTSGTGTGQSPAGGVPEPAAWALMLMGFGLAGAGLRRRRAGLTLLDQVLPDVAIGDL
ncbi:PEPxxWA-CTERM sorting domain-containing protein [Phenylobacterium sp.]|uniref:PEPxxWA-CTERM sorting domain-containing protein n=1 Tax=Phenylobacterium sp. TaxID=1871053 RepID=UPI002F42EFAA